MPRYYNSPSTFLFFLCSSLSRGPTVAPLGSGPGYVDVVFHGLRHIFNLPGCLGAQSDEDSDFLLHDLCVEAMLNTSPFIVIRLSLTET